MKPEKTVTVNGIKTAVRMREGEGPTIVCIHGNSQSQKIFNPLWGNTSLSTYPLVTFDLPGHGASEKPHNPEETYSIPGYTKHIGLLMEQLDISEAVLFGFSLGGHIAMDAAGNNENARYKGLFLIGSPPIDNLGDFAQAFIPMPEGASLFNETITKRHIEIINEHITDDKEEQRALAMAIAASDPSARNYLMQSFSKGLFHSEHEFLMKTKLPIRLIYGRNDKIINLEYLKEPRLIKLLEGRKKIIPGSGHLPDLNASIAPELLSFMENSIG